MSTGLSFERCFLIYVHRFCLIWNKNLKVKWNWSKKLKWNANFWPASKSLFYGLYILTASLDRPKNKWWWLLLKKIQRKNDINVIIIYYVLGTGAFLAEMSTEQGGKRGRQERAGLYLRVAQIFHIVTLVRK